MVGMTRRETEMVERFEAGQTYAEIAAAMGITVGVAEKITKYYTRGLVDDGKHRRAMVRASRQLLVALNTAKAT